MEIQGNYGGLVGSR